MASASCPETPEKFVRTMVILMIESRPVSGRQAEDERGKAGVIYAGMLSDG